MPKLSYPCVARRRAVAYQIERQRAQLEADHALEATVGQGVGYGLAIYGSEVALLRLAGGLRWAGALRTAAVVRNMSWAASEGELLGARAGWQGYGELSVREGLKVARSRLLADGIAQGGANFIVSDVEDFGDRALDALAGVNMIESGMAIYGLRPVGIGVGSAFFQYSYKDGFVSPLNHKLTWQAFGAQAGIGIVGGYASQLAEAALTRRMAYHFYRASALRLGHDIAYPMWVGSYHLLRKGWLNKGTVSGIGVTEEYLENKAQEQWEVPKSPAIPAIPTPLQP